MDEQTILDLVEDRKDSYKASYKDIRVMLLTIGFCGSGSSLVGFLLTAHPNIVMADEPVVMYKNGTTDGDVDCIYMDNLDKIFNTIFSVDYMRWLGAKHLSQPTGREGRYILVPNQYQGRFESATVVGIKRSVVNRIALSLDGVLQNLKSRLEERAISLKFIFTVRNPYDTITLKTIKLCGGKKRSAGFLKTKMNRAVLIHEMQAVKNTRLLNQIDPKDVFIYKSEDMITDPSSQLTRLCNFLQVPVSSDYLDSCASCVFKEPNRRRFEFNNWTAERKQKVAAMIEKYDFFSGYDWES